MGNFVHRTTKEYVRSGNDPLFDVGTWIHNPDLSSVAGVPNKYWDINGDIVSEMSAGDKTIVDAVLLQEQKDAEKEPIDNERLIQALTLTILDEINILRDAAGLQDRTVSQLKTAIKNRVDTL